MSGAIGTKTYKNERPSEEHRLQDSDMTDDHAANLVDPFGRAITYLRVSVTDRCDFRCTYCMAEDMTFLPRKNLLTLEEIDRLSSAFIQRGVRKLRLTGGEPLVRRNVMSLIESLSRHLGGGLDELTLTTNGSQLYRFADQLADLGVKRINVSLDTLDAAKFSVLTRWGDFNQVMRGIDAAARAGLKIKINAVALRDMNEDEIEDLLRWAHGRGFDLTLIETMPLGDVGTDRTDQYACPAVSTLRVGGHPRQDGRSRPLCPRARDRRASRLHHAHDPQFLRILQQGARDVHRHALYVPWPGRFRGSQGTDACQRFRRVAPRRD